MYSINLQYHYVKTKLKKKKQWSSTTLSWIFWGTKGSKDVPKFESYSRKYLKKFAKNQASLRVQWSEVLVWVINPFLRSAKKKTMKNECPIFSSFSPSCLPFFPAGQFKNSDHRPTRIVIFWQSPRKNYIFLCLSGSCLLFSMCEGKKWVGMPLDVFVGVKLDDMVEEGMGLGPLGGKGREGVEMLMHHRFLPLALVLLSQQQDLVIFF